MKNKIYLMTIFCLLTGYCSNMLKAQTGPGGVSTNLGLWISADSGGASWTDRSPLGTTVTPMGNPTLSVTSNNNQVNFNPAVTFNNATSYYDTGLSIARGTYSNVSIFTVANGRGENNRTMFSSSSANNHRALTSNAFACGNVPTYAAKNGYGIYRASFVTGTTNASTLSFNGIQQLATTDNNGSPINLKIGGGYYSAQSSDIAEMLVYRGTLTSDQIAKIQSYLAVKYGVTLGTSTAPVDYTNAYDMVVWTGGSSNPYQNNIAGIGRDDALSGLYQKQSQSVNGGFQPIIGKGNIAATNSSNGNLFTNDGDFLMWGSDTGSTNFTTTFAFGGLNNRMARIWKVQETGNVGMVKVAIPVSMWPGAVTQPALLVSNSTSFDATSIKTMGKETIGGIEYYTVTVNSSEVQYFSFAGLVTAPGGILGEKLWLKADLGTDATTDGASITAWNDQSGLNRNAGNANSVFFRAGNNNATSLNFNPAVDFTTTNSRIYNVTGGMMSASTANIHLFLISNPRSGASTDKMLGAFTNLGSSGSNNWNELPSVRIAGSYHAEAGSTGGTGSTISYNPAILGTTVLTSLSVSPSAGTVTLRQNGTQAGNLTGKSLQSGTQGYVLGNDVFGGGGNNLSALFTAGEVIAYEGELTGATLSKVESYLALKYGITKSGDYISSDAFAYWNSTSNSGYQNNIAGIGRDDASALNQKQSQSTSSGIQPIIGNIAIADTNANNNNDFGADKTFMVWGSDTGSTSFATPFAFGGLNNRMARIWKVQETGTVGKVRVAFKVSDLPGSVTKPTLLVSGNTTFDGSVDQFLMTKETIGGVEYYVTALSDNVDFSSGKYFSFAAFVTAPGGVVGESLWLKADAQVSYNTSNQISLWSDQSTSYNHATAGNNPTFKPLANNFNPGVSLATGSSQYFAVPKGFADFTGGTTVYVVAKPKSSANWARFIDFGNGESANNIVFTRYGTNPTIQFGVFNGSSYTSFDTTNAILNNINSIYGAIIPGASAGTSVTASILRNGSTLNTGSIKVPNNTDRSNNYIGRSNWSADSYYDGEFYEVIIYQSNKANEKYKIESYLALKYGITLSRDSDGDNTPGEEVGTAGSGIYEGDYIASNGTTKFWSTDATYQNNIAGIGRDDASALNQKQSQSVNAGIQPVIGNIDIADTNTNNTNDFAADKSFLVWGSDTGSTSFATPFAYGSSNFRMTRIWKIQKTGTIGTVKVAIPVSQLPITVTMPSLLISADATFDGSDARKSMTQVSLGGVQYYVAEVDTDGDGFTSGHFFSFAGFVTAPGGVAGVSLWLKADKGVSYNATNQVSAWNDQSGNPAITSQPTKVGGGNIIYANAGMNFNPTLDFDGTSGNRMTAANNSSTWDGALTIYGVAKMNNAGNLNAIFSSQYKSLQYYNNQYYLDGPACQSAATSVVSTGTSNLAVASYKDNSLDSGSQSFLNGQYQASSTASSCTASTTNGFEIGGRTSGGIPARVINGSLGEVIVYKALHTGNSLPRLAIESYLGIKYGITLSRNNNGNTTSGEVISGSVKEGDYLASNATTIFWESGDGTYHNNIAGIGRDDASALLQKQSQSVNTGDQLILGLSSVAATNAANTGTLNNLQFLVWGDNNEGNTVDFTGIVGYNSRLKRVWKVQNTNNVNQSVQVLVPSTLVPSNSSLLCGTDPTFGGNYFQYNPAPSPVIINSVSYRAFTVPAVMVNQDSFYMTLAFYEQSPGGVRGEAVWLRGDAGLTSTTKWVDQSSITNPKNLLWDIYDCQNAAPTGQMVLGKTLNFNPVASFGDAAWTWAFTKVNTSRTSVANADVAIIYKANSAGTYDVWGTDYGGGFDERSVTTTQIANDNTGIGYSGGNSGAATINLASFKGTTASGSNVVINGNNRLNFTGSTRYVGCPEIRLGDVAGAGTPFQGLIGEFVVYQDNISPIDRIQLNSYLALKYGITLGRDNNGNNNSGEPVSGGSIPVSEGDYLASNGTTKTWSSDAVYQNNVVGIGRDDISAFHQRITTSQSATPDIITLSTDSNFTNVNQSGASGHADIVNDKFFFVTGNNSGETSYAKKLGLSNGLNALMKRVWKVQRTGTVQDVYIKTTDNLATYLVYSNDPTFSSNVTYKALASGATQQGVQIPSGSYFTFATFMKWPGGVEDEVVWLRGDIGLTGTKTWLDQSGNSNNLRFDINDCLGGSAGQMTLGKTFNYNSVAGFGPGTGWTWGMIQADISRVSSPDADVAIMYKADAVKEQDVWGTDLGGILDERSLLTTKIANDNHSIGYTGGNSGYATINMASFKNTVSDGSNVLINGNNVLNFTGSTTYNGCSVIRLGDVPGNREDYNPFTGIFGEFVVFKKNITASQRIQLNSYLALKYGITLGRDNNGNGTSGENISAPIQEGDYLASYGTDRIWNSDAVYQNNVIGIGRDDITALHQRITKSQMPVSDIITLSTDSNFINNNQSGASGHTDISNDKYYFITGHNGQPTTFTLKSGLSNSLSSIMNRVWKVQQTGTAQNLYVKVNNVRAKYLIYSPDPTFSSNVEYAKLDNDAASGTSFTHDPVKIPSGNYFTFAAPLNGPGGVTDNLVRWYRADRDVVTGSTLTWKDQTVTEDAKQDTAGNLPVYNTSGASLLNFNPSFSFDAVQSKFMFFKDTGLASSNSARSVFGVGNTSSITAQWLTSYGTSSTGKIFGLISSGSNVKVSTYGTGNEITASGTPYLNNTPVISYGAVAGSTLYGAFNAFTPQNMTAASVSTTLSSNSGRIGTDQSGSNYWNGTIGEVVYYNKIPTPAEKARVDSYLALKYGVTLGNNSSTFSYVGSDGTTVWTGSNTYQNNIAGIGRDDTSDLIQRQSQSQDQTKTQTLAAPLTSVPQVIIGLGNVAATNEANTGSFDNNLQFLVWGDNNAGLEGSTTPFAAVYPYQERLNRVWRVQNTKSLSKDIQVLIPAAYIKALKVSSLLYSTDPAFPAGSQVFSSSSTGMVTINSVDYKAFTIPATQVALSQFYFTMAYYKKSPGGVVGENLWLRADDDEIAATADNTSVATWKDQSGNNSHATQADSNKQPVYKNNATDNMNFNPVLKFTGNATVKQSFDIAGDLGIGGQKNVAVFAVSDVLGAHYFLQPKVAGGNLLQFSSAGAGLVTLKLGGSSATNTTAVPSGGSAELYAGWRTTAGDVLYSGINAKQLNTAANTTVWTGGNFVLGIDASGNYTNGKIPEMVEYSLSLDATQLQKVNSYLALKYGITINQPTTGQDYLASDGNKSWTADATYKYNIAGIGRDDLTALNQKQSQSVNKGATANIETDSQLLVALNAVEASNSANTNTFSSDMQYLVWGDDNGSLTTRVATGNVTANGLTYTKRFSRVWKVQNKGSFADKIGVYYPVSAFGNASSSSVGLIFASTAAKLSDGNAFVIANSGKETINGTEYYAFYVSGGVVPSLKYLSFTTATSVCYKPAVTAGTALGTKAGITALGRAGVNADNWPMVRKGGWMALEAKTKGMIINRVRFKNFGTDATPNWKPVDDTETTPILTSPVEGMIVMDLTNRMLKVYTVKNGVSGWYEIGQQTCPD